MSNSKLFICILLCLKIIFESNDDIRFKWILDAATIANCPGFSESTILSSIECQLEYTGDITGDAAIVEYSEDSLYWQTKDTSRSPILSIYRNGFYRHRLKSTSNTEYLTEPIEVTNCEN